MAPIKNNLQLNSKANKGYSQLLSIILLSGVFIGFFRFWTYKIIGYAIIGAIIFILAWLFILLDYFLKNKDRAITGKLVQAWLIFLTFICLMYLMFPNTRKFYNEYMENLIVMLCIGVPGVVLIGKVDNIHEMLLTMGPYLRSATVLWCGSYSLGAIDFVGSMGWGSRMVPLAIFYYLYIREVDKKKIIDIILFSIALLFSFLGGRQSMLFVVVAIVFSFLFFTPTNKNWKNGVLKFIVVFFITLLIFFYNEFINSLIFLLNITGISSRSLNALVDGSLLDFTNRENNYKLSMEVIKKNGTNISGVFGDRYYLRQIATTIAYPHNIALELLIDFGTGLGSVILICLILGTILAFIFCKKELRAFYFAFLVYGVGRFLVSSSIFIEINFMVFIGLLFNKNIYKRKRKK